MSRDEVETKKKSVRLVPLYINAVLWKYIPIDLDTQAEESFAVVKPTYVTIPARQFYGKPVLSQYALRLRFQRVEIPLLPGVNEVGYYATSWNINVTDPGTGHTTFDVPSDPEARDERPWKT